MKNPFSRLALVFLMLLSLPSFAEDRALIMTIGTYPSSPLPGAALDDGNVRHMLDRLGFSANNIRSLKNKDLTAKGIEQALNRLVADTENGDRLFVYFSGHGTTQTVGGRCQQALVGHDLGLVSGTVLSNALKCVKDKASKVMIAIDAGYYAGMPGEDSRRGLRVEDKKTRFRPRYLESAQGGACDKPANLAEEILSAEMNSKRGLSIVPNYVFMAAARGNEAAYDDAERGGMVTASLRECLDGNIRDADNSGSISFGELAQCAQGRIDQLFSADLTSRSQHLTLSGNADMPLAVDVVTSDTTQAEPVATLKDILNGSDSRWQVHIESQPPRARIGKDAYHLTVTSSQGGYLYLFYVGSDHKEFLQLYPDARESNWISRDSPLRIPGEFAAQGPAGVNNLLAFVSHTPRDFKAIFKDQTAPASLTAATALQDVTCAKRNIKRVDCAANRGLARVKVAPVDNGDADSYGASLVELIEE